MKLAIRLLLYSIIIGVFAAFFFGMNGVVEWDVPTGKSRHVTTVAGIPVWYHKPKSTTVSEWLIDPVGDPEWIRVRGPNIRKAKVSHCVHRLLNDLHRLESGLQLSEDDKETELEGSKNQVARLILSELRKTRSVCDVSHHIYDFTAELVDLWEPETRNSIEYINELWLATVPDSQHPQ